MDGWWIAHNGGFESAFAENYLFSFSLPKKTWLVNRYLGTVDNSTRSLAQTAVSTANRNPNCVLRKWSSVGHNDMLATLPLSPQRLLLSDNVLLRLLLRLLGSPPPELLADLLLHLLHGNLRLEGPANSFPPALVQHLQLAPDLLLPGAPPDVDDVDLGPGGGQLGLDGAQLGLEPGVAHEPGVAAPAVQQRQVLQAAGQVGAGHAGAGQDLRQAAGRRGRLLLRLVAREVERRGGGAGGDARELGLDGGREGGRCRRRGCVLCCGGGLLGGYEGAGGGEGVG